MVPLDADSSTSLDGSSEEPFGPLVSGRGRLWCTGGKQPAGAGGDSSRGLALLPPSPMLPSRPYCTSLLSDLSHPLPPRQALLAVGFTQLEFERLQRLLHGELEAHMVRLVPGTTAALSSSLGAALEQDPPPPFEQAPLGTRRVLFLSGMYAAEVMEIIAAVRERGA